MLKPTKAVAAPKQPPSVTQACPASSSRTRVEKQGAVRKIPLMRVKVGASYVLIGSMGGQPKNPVWVYNLRAHPDVEIRDATEVTPMVVREVVDADERAALWAASAEAFPPYNDYQAKTDRVIPVFVAEPATKA